MPDVVIAAPEAQTVPIRLVAAGAAIADAAAAAWARANGFRGARGEVLAVPDPDGAVRTVLWGAGEAFDPLSARALPARLPAGDYAFEGLDDADAALAALAFALGAYRFDRYKPAADKAAVRLVAPAGVDLAGLTRIAAAAALAREMVDTPAADMGPLQIETIAREIAEESGAAITVTTGDALLEANYPAIHAVGRAAAPHRA
ncbi:MAG: leucyl aminopeptidase family protein, partial [Brevundimonas sp.]